VENNESAVLIPANDPTAMATAIARVLNDRAFATGLTTKSAALIASLYTPAQYVRSLVEIFQETINARGTG
jgi:glycosyltransferase involved in cell wall biosynthesis